MIQRIIRFSAENKFLVLAGGVLALCLSFWAMRTIPMDALPAGVKTELGPDATAVGWVYQYALIDRSNQHSTDELRSTQDWFVKYALQSVPGVAEVELV